MTDRSPFPADTGDVGDLEKMYAAAADQLVRAAPPINDVARHRLLDVVVRARRTSKAA